MSSSSDLAWAVLVGLALAADSSQAADLTVVVSDLNGQHLQDAVVYAERLGEPARPPVPQPKATIDQVNRQFVPLVTVLRTGTEVRFPNSDNIRHSIYSFSAAKTFTIKLYSGKEAAPIVFDKPGLVTLGCNIHDTMVAWVVVVDTPFFAKTGPDGSAVLSRLDPGDYHLSIWYPQPQFDPKVVDVHVESGDLRREVAVDASASPLPELRARAAAG